MNACKLVQGYGPLIGRLLLANLFIIAGYKKIAGFTATLGYMAGKMPAFDPSLMKVLLVLTILIELGGGLLILIGWQARWAAVIIFLFLIPVSYIFHAYWGLDADQMRMQFTQFQKNMAIMGGLLYIITYGSGPLSLGKNECHK